MTFRILADVITALHLAFVLFVIFGGLLALHWPRLAWLHVPAALWGSLIEICGFPCPLTYWENRFRWLAAQSGYSESFSEHYLLPLIYPELLFAQGFPRQGFIALGILILAANALIYLALYKKRTKA